MFSGYNVFAPEDLDLAESILKEVWDSFPDAARKGPRAQLLREQVARQILAAMSDNHSNREALKASLMSADIVTAWSWRCDDTPLSGTGSAP